MNKITILSICLLILFLAIKVNIVFAAAVNKDHQETICDDSSDQECLDSFKNPELETIKLKPKIRRYEHQQVDQFDSNELLPFIGGSGKVR